ncbi:predicted protein [Scheffersomyces stipitis CBS 6054]|uniref:UDP-N-acetylglucosamine transferase subunit ALG14 n=1 Tax=Scheffersomyces stipitis (strain ATCC 58785 / CBS 6054 / NBRC 10063 / NRRL Y-11545) TaxID=322104 RepID=A3LW92_PICST|nr:predicted protein [Scheffersomyces stipitis CBS 6054]ABN66926.2 predicted protein [Scheffersomyces stipitis CBS 6054]KAG2734133.1 hypothetical protein G9P44_002139 [Scheffersomyces stipitis]
MDYETKLVFQVGLLLLPIFVVALRVLAILPSVGLGSSNKDLKSISDITSGTGSSIMVLLGSGGHTGEMMRILSNVDLSSVRRTWVVSSGDSSSLVRAKEFEDKYQQNGKTCKSSEYLTLYRARKVGESLLSSLNSTVRSFVDTVNQLRKLPELPSVLLLNGPGTSVPLAYILFGMKFFGLCNTRIIYIESLARVNKLSLSGLLLLPISDRFIVQWEQLYHKYKRAEYYGILI